MTPTKADLDHEQQIRFAWERVKAATQRKDSPAAHAEQLIAIYLMAERSPTMVAWLDAEATRKLEEMRRR